MWTSHSMECHHQVKKLCEWEIIYKNHLSAAHIPGNLNTVFLQGILIKSGWYWMDAPIKVFESGIRTFMIQTRNRSTYYQY